jgi:hypothetical protein
VTARGNERREIFLGSADNDRVRFLGSAAFVATMQRLIGPERPRPAVPKRQRRPVAKPLEHFRLHHQDRDRGLAEAYGTGMYSMEAIAEHFGISRMTDRQPGGEEGCDGPASDKWAM